MVGGHGGWAHTHRRGGYGRWAHTYTGGGGMVGGHTHTQEGGYGGWAHTYTQEGGVVVKADLESEELSDHVHGQSSSVPVHRVPAVCVWRGFVG